MRQGGLRAVFQPIVDLKSAAVHAHEALIRGPEDSPLHRPDALLRAAQDEGLLYEFELFCLQVALRRWGALRQPGRLFLNISANALSRLVDVGGTTLLAQGIRNLQVSPRKVVLEITEHERVHDVDALCEVSRALQSEGLALALDDFGDGRSSLRLWSQLKPDIVKIDKYFSHDIHESADRLKTLQALLQIADVFGTSLVAEGIEHEAELRVIRDLGVTYGQGWLLGRPGAEVSAEPAREAVGVLLDTRVAVLPEQRYVAQRGQLRHLSIIDAPTLTPATSNDEAAAMFQANPGLHAMAVLEGTLQGDGGGDRPIAILNRQQFMDHYATLYFREIHGRKSCIKHANREPRLIERNFDIEELVGILTSQDQRYLSDGFIVTDNGRYVGLGTGDQLVRSVTELRLEAARHANPLTSLPGNIPISLHMQRLLDSGGAFTVCYLDLDNFKPFNDHYGYWRGDEMIRLLARLAAAHSDPQRDFVGHVGGDDFMILFQSEDWRSRCERIIATFARQARELYDEEGRTRGGVEAEDRQGVRRFFPCTTVSIGAVRVAGGEYRDAEELATKASLSKHEAKLAGGLHVMGEVAAPARALSHQDNGAHADA
ncbi:GGDEF domain-containing protein [Hylemonella sp. W303a]|uniref:GGDEF domain-containing protein n=1 Tax=Hylemonella sp. W303a TaxID=3389873 RepID=UPI00396AF91E